MNPIRMIPPRRRPRWRTALAGTASAALGVALVAAGGGAAQAATGGSPPQARALSIRGADLSFTPQEEAAGTVYRNRAGQPEKVEDILAGAGANWLRLRVWVDPPAGYSDLASALAMAKRADAAGMKVLLDLHYSDFWADPGHQSTPAAWAGENLTELSRTVRSYTRNTVAAFADQGTPVDMVAIGNEVTDGMLWPTGELYTPDGRQHWGAFTKLLKAGIAGAHAGNPAGHELRTMVHIDRGGDNGGSEYFYDHLAAYHVPYDVIGLSYYPFWHGSLADLKANLDDLATRYGKPLVVAETAYPWTLRNGDDLANLVTSTDQLPQEETYPPTPHGQAVYFESLRKILRTVPDGLGEGFFDWEPEWLPGVGWEPGAGNPNDNLTMFRFDGRALPSIRAFREPVRH